MKFKEYVAICNQLLIDNPDIGDFEAMYNADDEGNDYSAVNFPPSVAYIDMPTRCFIHPEDWDDYDVTEPNSVIIN